MEIEKHGVVSVGLLFLGAAVVLAAAGGLFTGNSDIVSRTAPSGLVGLAVALIGVWQLEKAIDIGG